MQRFIGFVFVLFTTASRSLIAAESTNVEQPPWSPAVRLPTLTIMKDRWASEVGVELGFRWQPDVQLFAYGQTGIVGQPGYGATVGNIHHIGGGARYFVTKSFYFGGGLAYRKAHTNLGDTNSNLEPGEVRDVDGHEDYDVYGSITAETVGMPLSLGWQWRISRVTLGLEAVNVFLPIVSTNSRGKYDTDYNEGDHSPDEVTRYENNFRKASDVSFPRVFLALNF